MNKILICEDEENIVSFLRKELEFEGFVADAAFDGNQAVAMFAQRNYDLVLLDVMLPEKNGLECLREFRKTSDIPVIILTARKEVYDKVAFLSAGADDYVTKPFDTLELIARVKRNIVRTEHKHDTALSIQKENYRASIGANEIPLTKTEFEILVFLHENSNKVKTRDEIINAVFGEFYGESNIIDSNIKNIRAKIAKHSSVQIIETVRGKGYVIR
ncbi:MAG: response regulator transcription factor [Clostridiales bacterium]|jgi:two-component system response regulator ArlR|nr:response regulator transcription factor [Clostridiales bacterium]